MKTFFKETLPGIIALLFVLAMIVTIVILAPKKYNEYLNEYENAPREVLLGIESITIPSEDSSYFIVLCEDGNTYRARVISFDEDVEEPVLLLDKVGESVGLVRFVFNNSFGSGTKIYRATIYLQR